MGGRPDGDDLPRRKELRVLTWAKAATPALGAALALAVSVGLAPVFVAPTAGVASPVVRPAATHTGLSTDSPLREVDPAGPPEDTSTDTSTTMVAPDEADAAERGVVLQPDFHADVTSRGGQRTVEAASPTPTSRREPMTYRVMAGDTVSALAEYFGVSAQTIVKANGIADAEALALGQELVILPRSGGPSHRERGRDPDRPCRAVQRHPRGDRRGERSQGAVPTPDRPGPPDPRGRGGEGSSGGRATGRESGTQAGQLQGHRRRHPVGNRRAVRAPGRNAAPREPRRHQRGRPRGWSGVDCATRRRSVASGSRRGHAERGCRALRRQRRRDRVDQRHRRALSPERRTAARRSRWNPAGASGRRAGASPAGRCIDGGGNRDAAAKPDRRAGDARPRSAPQPTTPAIAKPPAIAAPAPAAPGAGARIVAAALKYRGARYTWGGTSPATGFDCSGFVWYAYTQAGVPLPRDLWGQYNSGRRVGRGELQPGDIVFFQNTYRPGLSHDGIYIGSGQFIHAASENTGVIVSSLGEPYWAARYLGATRP